MARIVVMDAGIGDTGVAFVALPQMPPRNKYLNIERKSGVWKYLYLYIRIS